MTDHVMLGQLELRHRREKEEAGGHGEDQPTPRGETRTPASAGATIRERFICAICSETAFMSRCRGTS